MARDYLSVLADLDTTYISNKEKELSLLSEASNLFDTIKSGLELYDNVHRKGNTGPIVKQILTRLISISTTQKDLKNLKNSSISYLLKNDDMVQLLELKEIEIIRDSLLEISSFQEAIDAYKQAITDKVKDIMYNKAFEYTLSYDQANIFIKLMSEEETICDEKYQELVKLVITLADTQDKMDYIQEEYQYIIYDTDLINTYHEKEIIILNDTRKNIVEFTQAFEIFKITNSKEARHEYQSIAFDLCNNFFDMNELYGYIEFDSEFHQKAFQKMVLLAQSQNNLNAFRKVFKYFENKEEYKDLVQSYIDKEAELLAKQ